MIKSKELKCFYEISWKIKGISTVFNQIKLENSKIWSGIPYLSRKKLGLDRVNYTFESMNSLIGSILNDFGTICYQYNKIYRNVIITLQNAGVFINNQWTEDLLQIRVDEANTITKVADEIIKNISKTLNVNANIDKGIDNPNIIDLFAINKSRVHVAGVIIDECKNYFNSILNTTLEADRRATNNESQEIRECVSHINECFEDLKNCLTILDSYFDELTNDIINTLRSVFIEVEVKSERENEINQVIGYYDIADIYRMIRGTLKCEQAFNRLLENKSSSNDNSSIKPKNDDYDFNIASNVSMMEAKTTEPSSTNTTQTTQTSESTSTSSTSSVETVNVEKVGLEK